MILWQLKEMKTPYGCTYFVLLISILTLLSFLAGELPFVTRVNVLAGQRPLLSDDDCVEGYREIIVRCWDGQPDCRLHFKGKSK